MSLPLFSTSLFPALLLPTTNRSAFFSSPHFITSFLLGHHFPALSIFHPASLSPSVPRSTNLISYFYHYYCLYHYCLYQQHLVVTILRVFFFGRSFLLPPLRDNFLFFYEPFFDRPTSYSALPSIPLVRFSFPFSLPPYLVTSPICLPPNPPTTVLAPPSFLRYVILFPRPFASSYHYCCFFPHSFFPPLFSILPLFFLFTTPSSFAPLPSFFFHSTRFQSLFTPSIPFTPSASFVSTSNLSLHLAPVTFPIACSPSSTPSPPTSSQLLIPPSHFYLPHFATSPSCSFAPTIFVPTYSHHATPRFH